MRSLREGLDNERQLAVFDLLQKDTLTPKEREATKNVAMGLLVKLEKGLLLMDHLRGLAAKQAEFATAIDGSRVCINGENAGPPYPPVVNFESFSVAAC